MTFVLCGVYLLVMAGGVVSISMVMLRGRREVYNTAYLSCQGLAILWCASQLFYITCTNQWEIHLANLLSNFGICFIGTVWYYFAGLYTSGRLSWWEKFIPMVLSLFHYGMVLTNRWHHWYYVSFQGTEIEHGMFYYTNVIVTYILLVWGAVRLYRGIRVKEAEDGDGMAPRLIVLAVLFPVVFNVIYQIGSLPFPYDITPLGFGISVIILLVATVRYRFLDVNLMERELVVVNEQLILEKERNRIAGEVHDTAGHTLTMIRSYMKLALVANERGEHRAVNDYLEQARDLAGNGIRELRQSINHLRQEAAFPLVTQGIMQLADQVKEIPVEVTVQGEDREAYSHLSKILYDCTREAITNTLKYAKAGRMDIVLRFQEKQVELMVADDGQGCAGIRENNGIAGIRKRVNEAGGEVRFLSSPGEGFMMRIRLPL
ncbi:MAG: sensor histidine kinase [Eubacteriales bacterium]|nr:sensor histidine kinase [Eubacteriales bacterium]